MTVVRQMVTKGGHSLESVAHTPADLRGQRRELRQIMSGAYPVREAGRDNVGCQRQTRALQRGYFVNFVCGQLVSGRSRQVDGQDSRGDVR